MLVSEIREKKDPQQLSDSDLIDYILERFHERHRTQLESMIPLAQKVETVHASEVQCPRGLSLQLKYMASELEQHMFKEENILFPVIRAGQGEVATRPISVMRYEHEQHNREIDILAKITRDLELPENACGSWRRLYREIHEFVADLKEHIALENDVLFARQLVHASQENA